MCYIWSYENVVLFYDQCIVFDLHTAVFCFNCATVEPPEICNICYVIKWNFNCNTKKFSIDRSVFHERNQSFNFPFLNDFLKAFDGPFFIFSFSYNKILISLDNPDSNYIQQVH